MDRGIVIATVLSLLFPLRARAAYGVPEADGASPAAGESRGTGPESAQEPLPRVGITVVVTASRREQLLDQAPVAATVLGEERIARTPAADVGDLLREAPGLNVARTSAGELLVSGRQATGVLPRGQMVLVDDRTQYFDFNGSVLWSVLPVDLSEVKRIEVARGPGSAVWGANAVDGVINIITKTPAEAAGTTLQLGGGERSAAFASFTQAGVRGQLGYRLSASLAQQEPYGRPTGVIPGSAGPTNRGGTPYPLYRNDRLEQRRANVRLDYDRDPDTTWSAAAGFGETGGLVLTPGGPYDHDGTWSGFARADWRRRAARATLFANLLRSDGVFLLSGLPAAFDTETFAADFTNTSVLVGRHLLTYGASARHNRFDLDLAPEAEERQEAGAFVEGELRFGERVRWFLGGRWDHLDPVGSVLSPRTSLLLSVHGGHSVRLSYQRAFSAPTVVENFLDIATPVVVTLPTPVGPAAVSAPFRSTGNRDLDEQRLDSLEVGWVGELHRRVTATMSLYRTEIDEFIRLVPTSFYDSTQPPPGWPLPPALLDLPAPQGFAGAFPATMSYFNVGSIVNRGVELSLDLRPAEPWSVHLGYSWQDDPEVEDIPPTRLPSGEVRDSINAPPAHRFTAGASYDRRRGYLSGKVGYQSDAFWTDVLAPVFWGPTDPFTQVDVGGGLRWAEGRATVAVDVLNLLDEDVQQHVFGDVFGRRVTARLLLRF